MQPQQRSLHEAAPAATAPAATTTSNPTTHTKPPTRRRKLPYILYYLLPLASLAYLLLLPHHPLIAQRIYTDENAWAADGARDAVTAQHVQHAQHVQSALVLAADATGNATATAALALLRDTLARLWRHAGLDVHRYVHRHGEGGGGGGGRWVGEVSEVVYAVVPARMGDGKEAVAVVVEYDAPRQLRRAAVADTMSAVAVASGLAQYLLGVPWLARDVLLVAVENSGDKLKAIDAFGGWLHTYRSPSALPSASTQHNVSNLSSAQSSSSFSFHRSGSILAALCLDMPLHTPATSTFTLHVGGLYGLSPNLDIVSVLLQMLHRRGLHVSVADALPPHSLLSSAGGAGWEWVKDEYRGLARSMVQHVTGEATGFHGHFIANNIDAITLQAARTRSQHAFTGPLLSALDGFFHSMNNLVEKLHHSTWLYMLVSSTHFVTMSKYVYAFALLAAPLPLIALSQLFGNHHKRWLQAGGVALCLYAVGWSIIGIAVATRGLSGAAARAAVAISIVSCSAALGGATVLSGWWRTARGDGLDWRTLQAIVLLSTFFVISPLAILNFPLSIALLALLVPLVVHVRPMLRLVGGGGLRAIMHGLVRLSQLAVLVVFSPFTILIIFATYWKMGLAEALRAMLIGLAHVDNALYVLLPGVYLPVYLMSWLLWSLPAAAATEQANATLAADKDKKLT